MIDDNEGLIGRSLTLRLGEAPLLAGTIEGYADGELIVSCPLTDTKTGEVKYAKFKIPLNNTGVIFSMEVEE